MRLKKLTDFRRDHLVEPRPSIRTLRTWTGARKMGGQWYIDMDVFEAHASIQQLASELVKKPKVAQLVG
jgi:hypothetical protein